jgi:SagB-type dehydrogenase family enzyme
VIRPIRAPYVRTAAVTTLLLAALLSGGCKATTKAPASAPVSFSPVLFDLPAPRTTGQLSLEEALSARRSVRDYASQPLTLAEVSQLLWAAQGITSESGGRTAPSAGGLYPLEVYLVAGAVEGLSPGVYRYVPALHQLARVRQGDVRAQLAAASLDQAWVRDGAACIVIAAAYARTTVKYGDRGVRYVHLEAGHAAQNVCLEATALGLGTVTVGAFYDDRVAEVIGLSRDDVPLYLLPVGNRQWQ